MKKAIGVFCCLIFISAFLSCGKKAEDGTFIDLRYSINFKGDSVTNKFAGLQWALSYLGAVLPDSSFKEHCLIREGQLIHVCFDSLGFAPEAMQALKQLTDSLKRTEEYKVRNSIEIGEFIVLTVGTSRHYYAITGVSKTLSDFKKKYFTGDESIFPVINSSVSEHHRLLRIHADSSILKSAFIAEEGNGDINNNTFKAAVYEVFDIMPNGQLRFAIYNEAGELIDSSPAHYSEAGKPAKCLWCHEINIQPLFRESPDLKNYMTSEAFTELVTKQMKMLDAYRKQIKGGVDFEKTQQHTQMELLYLSYMEPSIERLSQEWNISEDKLKMILKADTVHNYTEFPFLGNLYYRSMLKKHSPYKQNPIPESVRELKGGEPFYLNK